MNFLKRFIRNRGAVIGILILLAVIAFAVTWACMGLIQLVGRGARGATPATR